MEILFAGRTKKEYLPLLKEAEKSNPKLVRKIIIHLKNEEKYMKRLRAEKLLAIILIIISLIGMFITFRINNIYFILALAFFYFGIAVCMMINDANKTHLINKKNKERKYLKKLESYK